MELRRLCAYNQTRECFLGLEVAVADLSSAELNNLLEQLALKSGEGLWMAPFRGIPETDTHVPLDLMYLDEDCRVIEVVESFPTSRVSASSPHAASVLALPAHSIYLSQSQAGDQLVLCVAEEMQRRLEGVSSSGFAAVQNAAVLRSVPLWSGGPGVVELEKPSGEKHPGSQPVYEMDLVEAGTKKDKPPKSWLRRWWSPDPRRAPRMPASGLAAYYWTGAAPKARDVRDVSSTGLYVVTEERWYPGTLILMTLQPVGDGEGSSEQAIAVHSRAVRWGNDGVGLQFIPLETPAHDGPNPLLNGVDQKQIDQFLERLKKGKDKT
jgi:hypothetical protein